MRLLLVCSGHTKEHEHKHTLLNFQSHSHSQNETETETKVNILYSSFRFCIIWCFGHVKWSFTFPKDTKYQLNANVSACDKLSWPFHSK